MDRHQAVVSLLALTALFPAAEAATTEPGPTVRFAPHEATAEVRQQVARWMDEAGLLDEPVRRATSLEPLVVETTAAGGLRVRLDGRFAHRAFVSVGGALLCSAATRASSRGPNLGPGDGESTSGATVQEQAPESVNDEAIEAVAEGNR